jgi:hypothetical protein
MLYFNTGFDCLVNCKIEFIPFPIRDWSIHVAKQYFPLELYHRVERDQVILIFIVGKKLFFHETDDSRIEKYLYRGGHVRTRMIIRILFNINNMAIHINYMNSLVKLFLWIATVGKEGGECEYFNHLPNKSTPCSSILIDYSSNRMTLFISIYSS